MTLPRIAQREGLRKIANYALLVLAAITAVAMGWGIGAIGITFIEWWVRK